MNTIYKITDNIALDLDINATFLHLNPPISHSDELGRSIQQNKLKVSLAKYMEKYGVEISKEILEEMED